MDTRYKLLSEDDVMQSGDTIMVCVNKLKIQLKVGEIYAGRPVKEVPKWQKLVVAVLRPPTTD